MSADIVRLPERLPFAPRASSMYRRWLVYEQTTLIASFKTRRELEAWCRDFHNLCGRSQLTVLDPRDRIVEQSAPV